LTFSRVVRLSLIARPSGSQRAARQAVDRLRTETSSEKAVNALLEEYLDAVYRYALRLTHDHEQAQDLTQETMLRAWRKRRALHEPAATKVWLLRIATNLWTDEIRRAVRRPRLLVDSPPSREPTAGNQLIQQENVALAMAALDQLPTKQRQVIYLVTVEQLKQSEVAQILEMTTEAVKANLSLARKQMREQLQDLYEEVCGKKRCPTNE